MVNRRAFISIKKRLPGEFTLCELIGNNGEEIDGWRVIRNRYDGLYINKIDLVVGWRNKK